MAYTGNGPEDVVILRLEARKSFSLGIWIEDRNGNPLDITGCTLRFVARKSVPSGTVDDSGNLITNSVAMIMSPTLGFARFSFQAEELDWKPGEYLFAIVLSDEGYTSTIVKGQIELDQNTEFASTGENYTPGTAATDLRVILRENTAITVQAGPTLAPGQATFSSADRTKLDEIYAGAVAEGETLNADLIPDGVTKVMMTTAERAKLADLEITWDSITGKPAFGDIITYDADQFVQKLQGDAGDIVTGVLHQNRIPLVMGLRGISHGTGAPPSGNPNTIYLKHA